MSTEWEEYVRRQPIKFALRRELMLPLCHESVRKMGTLPGHRNMGLANHCVFEMLRQCSQKQLTVHWDAQNPASANMAKSHGFVLKTEYAVYWIDLNMV